MIIECVNCAKKFSVNSDLIPEAGRTIQCGSCNHVWFFKRDHQEQLKVDIPNIKKKTNIPKQKKVIKKSNPKNESQSSQISDDDKDRRDYKIVEYKSKSKFTFSKFLSYIVVLIISFVGFLIVVDTFKVKIYENFPNLEILIFSLFETLKDITLFVKDLI
tara:strand:- start:6892 stop:7371 length:480 start_codon:yes stop_codon:yes gene_type:complete